MATTVEELNKMIRDFCEARDWNQYHNPKDLAIGICTEAGELLDIFRFKSEIESKELMKNPAKREHVEEELADILYFTLRFADMNNIDVKKALEDKLEKNNAHYPVELVKGKNKKYSEY